MDRFLRGVLRFGLLCSVAIHVMRVCFGLALPSSSCAPTSQERPQYVFDHVIWALGYCYDVALYGPKHARAITICISFMKVLFQTCDFVLAELVADRLVPPKVYRFSAELVADRLVPPQIGRFLAELVADRLVPPDWSKFVAELVADRLVLPLSVFG